MDITSNWRLKLTRSQLLAAQSPSGDVILPQQTSLASRAAHVALYEFELDAPQRVRIEEEASLAQAAR